MVEQHPVSFQSGGARCDGCLYLPVACEGRIPNGVVLAHGFGGSRHAAPARTALAFAEAGFAALTFDYRSFGASEGMPRRVVDIRGQLEDWRAAIRFLRASGTCDPARIALWGSSLAGAHVVHVAAYEETIAAVVAQIPFDGFPRKVEGRDTRTSLALLGAILRDRIAGWLGRTPHYVPLVGPPGSTAIVTTGHAARIVQALGGTDWENSVAPRALLDMMTWYRPSRVAHRLRMPILLCLAKRDAHTPAAQSMRIAERAPRVQVQVQYYDASHFDFYEEPLRAAVTAQQIDFLRSAMSQSHREERY